MQRSNVQYVPFPASGRLSVAPLKSEWANDGARFVRPPRRHRPIIGRELPTWLRPTTDRASQGPVPDKQLTPTAQTSEELDVNTPKRPDIARVVFVSNGVDEWINEFEPDPSGPPPAPDDPNHVPDGQIDRWGLSDSGFNIWLMRHDGTQQLQITDMAGDERDPAYDPGSNTLAFANDRTGTFQIYTVDVLTKTVRQITTDPGNKRDPTWALDTSRIIYATDINGLSNHDIYSCSSRGVGAPIPLAATPADETQPTAAPFARAILYTRNDGVATHVWSMDADGSNQEQLTNGGGNPLANDCDPAWRQDGLGTQFAFASDRLTGVLDKTPEYNIWSATATGEIVGAPAVLHSNTDPDDTKDDRHPAFSALLLPIPPTGPARAPVRIFFTSYRMDSSAAPIPPTAEPDIWASILEDDRPPVLEELPTVDNRNPAPGSDVIVRCKPYDDETGIATVHAWFKDPDCAVDDAQGIDHKQYLVLIGVPFEPNNTFPGDYWWELDCQRVGTTELFDDGDMVNNGDETAGDGIYSGIWTTPTVPSDFIIDIELTDEAGNFVNFDDVYGLSTVTFAPSSNVLLVNDYMEGQEFLGASGFNNQMTNDWSFAFPAESYYTTNYSHADPLDINNVAYNTFRDGQDGAGTNGEAYDLWRVICRGAPDLQTLLYYQPYSETQLTTDLSGLREVPVANRAVFWAAPHTGDVWAAGGSLTDASTQALLSQFVGRGGRLAVAGMDIAWALTLDGRVANPFLSTVLGATYVRDDNTGQDYLWNPTFSVEGPQGDLLVDDPWYNRTHYNDPLTGVGAINAEDDGWNDSDDDTRADMDHPRSEFIDFQPPILWVGIPVADGYWFGGYPDVIRPSGSQQIYGYGAPDAADGAAVKRVDTATGARVVYYAFPFSALHRHYHTAGNPAQSHCRNKRSKLVHVTLCWLRTGGLQGSVLASPGRRPVTDPEPIVTVHNRTTGEIIHAQRCLKDGTYVINGIAPGIYAMEATRPGYKMDKFTYQWVHGGLDPRVRDFVIGVAQPGAIQGTVTSLATGEPIANVTVTAVSATDPMGAPPVPSVLTGADGTYIISDVPVDDYDVTADGSTATPPYGSDSALVSVIPGGSVTQDFQLPAADGTLEVTVTSAETGAPLEGATVDARLNSVAVGSGATDNTGFATLDLPPGDYDVLADMPGFAQATKAATVLSAQTVAIEIQMTPLPPGSIAGQIYRASTPDQPLGGVEVRVIVGSSIVARVNSQDTWTYPGGNNPRYNYFVPDVPAGGRVEVQAVKTGFTVTPDQRVVQVSSGTVTYNVNFTVSALHTFPAGLQFVSVPFDYSNQDPRLVLGTPSGQNLRMAVWDPSLARYAVYPTSPADRLRLGVGFWLNLPQAQDLVSEGRRAGSPFYIPLGIGWNGIGNPFRKSVDFFSLKVRDSAGVVRPIQEAFAMGQVQPNLYGYTWGGYQPRDTLVPYSGYWVRANQAVSLVVEDPSASVAAASADEARRTALPKPEEGWLAPIVVRSAGMTDGSAAFGIAPGADDQLDVPQLPVPPMGSHVYCAFAAPNGSSQAVDVRPGGDQTWTLDIHTTEVRSPVTVTWPDLTQLPGAARPILHDPTTGQKVYMRTAREYTYRPKGKADRRLEIEVNDAPQGLLTVTAASAPQGDGATLTYTLSRDAQVTIEVRNIAGRIVAQPIAAKPTPAGRNTTAWNGQQHDGLDAPAGMYFATIVARSDDGQQVSAVTTLTLRR